MDNQEISNSAQKFLFYNPVLDGKPTIQDYMAELNVRVFSPLVVVHEMLMLLDEAVDDDEDKMKHLMNVLWSSLETWKSLNNVFVDLSKGANHEGN